MPELISDEIREAAIDALDHRDLRVETYDRPLSESPGMDDVQFAAMLVLDAVAPLIAAKALRDAAADDESGWALRTWLNTRADEIEGKR